MAELDRCVDFIRRLAYRAAAEKVPFQYGVGILHADFPRVWSRNYLLVENNLDGASAELLAAEADRILGGAGLAHRKVELYDAEAGARMEAGFHDLGWDVECDVVMVARRDPDREVDVSAAEEVTFEALAPVWAEGIRIEPSLRDEQVVQQLVGNKQVVMKAVDTRFFAASVDGHIASYCDLYSDGQTAQIEAVMTLERHRNHGLARVVVSRALAASREAGNDLTFLLAHRDDWPKELYRKLGFDEIGHVYEFVKPR
jgi:GNAT superfamily N-acetyltransferase